MAAQNPEPAQSPIDRALERIADGASVRAACDNVGLNKGWLWQRMEREPELATRYARAREMQAESDAAEIDETVRKLLALADAGPVDNGTVSAYARAIDALKWTAARKHPRVYGDRIEVAGRTEVAVTISLGAPAPNMLAPNIEQGATPRIIEAQVVRDDARTEKRGAPKPAARRKRKVGPKGA